MNPRLPRNRGGGRWLRVSVLASLLTLVTGVASAEPLLFVAAGSLESGAVDEVMVLPDGSLVQAADLRRSVFALGASVTGTVAVDLRTSRARLVDAGLPLTSVATGVLWFWYAPERGYFLSIDGGMASDGTSVAALEELLASPGHALLALPADFAPPEVAPVCGDLNFDDRIDVADVELLRAHLHGTSLSPAQRKSCRVIDRSDPCDILQLVVLFRAAARTPLPPGIAEVCPAATGG